MTPAERLLAAADLLEKRAGEATEGPWAGRVFADEYSDVIGKQEVNQYSGSYTVTTALVAGGASEVGDPGWLAPANARYIATMHPEVGKALAALLRTTAIRADEIAAGFKGGWSCSINIEPIVAGGIPTWRESLALADLLLAGAS